MLRKKDREAIAWLAGGLFVWRLFAKRLQPVPLTPAWFGVPGEWGDYIAAAQESDMLCWAASVQMILGRYGIPTSQSQVVTNAYGGPLNEPGSDEAISANLNGLAFTVDGKQVAVCSHVVHGCPTAPTLLAEFRRWDPILLTYGVGDGIGHAVVATAGEFFPTPSGPLLTCLVYRDPSPTRENLANNGRVELRGPELWDFLASVRSHWLIRVRYTRPEPPLPSWVAVVPPSALGRPKVGWRGQPTYL